MYSNKYNKIAIMQPTFLPWVGYFALINAVDLFIFLDSVQFDKRSWQQRNIIKTINGSSWLTVPVISKGKFQQKINEVEILNDSNFNNKIIKKIYANYSKAKFFKLYSEDIFKIIIEENKMLSQLNYKLIKYFLKVWEIKTRLSYSSKLNVTGYKDELLYNILSSYKSELYVSPPGSETYLKESKFFGKQQNQKNYELFKFKHPEWSQLYGDFLPYCSAIDLLFNMGKEGKSIIESGYF